MTKPPSTPRRASSREATITQCRRVVISERIVHGPRWLSRPAGDSDGAEITYPTDGEAFFGQDALACVVVEELVERLERLAGALPLAVGVAQAIDYADKLDWQDALAYADDADLGGFSDWRLPNVKELHSIVDYSRSPLGHGRRPSVPPSTTCSPHEITNKAGDSDYGYFWSSTSAHFTSGEPYYYAWNVAFGRAVNGSGGLPRCRSGALRHQDRGRPRR